MSFSQLIVTKEGDEFITKEADTGEKVGVRKFTPEGIEIVSIQ